MAAQGPSFSVANNAEIFLQLGELGKAAKEALAGIRQAEKAAADAEKKGVPLDQKMKDRLKRLDEVHRKATAGMEAQEVQRDKYDQTREFKERAEVFEKTFGNTFARKLAAGEAIGGKDILQEIIYGDRTIRKIATKLGAKESTLQMLGSVGLVAFAAKMGWDIGDAIRENIDKHQSVREKIQGQMDRRESTQSLKDVLEGDGGLLSKIETLGIPLFKKGGEARLKAVEDIEKITEALNKDVTGEQLGAALGASRRKGAAGDEFLKADPDKKQWLLKKDMRVGNKIIAEINAGETLFKLKNRGAELSPEDRRRIREEVIADFVRVGEISGAEAEEIKLIRAKKPTTEQEFKERREKQIYEMQIAIMDKRVPPNPTD